MITFDDVSKGLGGKEILHHVSFQIEPTELAVIFGASGTGKTTLLRLITGTIGPDSGTVTTGSNRIGFVFQDHRLLPWKTALENVALVLIAQGIEHTEARRKAAAWLDMVGLGKYGNYYPAQLSGGMVQRVSIARAFAVEPDIILMDEPFSSLDDKITDSLLLMVQKVLAEYKTTVMYVTHDFVEGVRLADRLFVLDEEELLEVPIIHRQELLQEYCNGRLHAMTYDSAHKS